MTKADCERYLEDPEANAGHLEACADCRAFFETLDDEAVESPSIDLAHLPLASWEGSSHRAWPLVVAVAALVAVIAFTVSTAAGTSPLHAFASSLPPFDLILTLMQGAGGAIHNAPVAWQVVIIASFFVVNGLLWLLLRRAPKGVAE